MGNQRRLPSAIFAENQEYAHLQTPERRLHLELLLRALEDAIFPCHRQHRVSAVNWFKQVVEDPYISFSEVCASLELGAHVVQVILKEVAESDKRQTKRKCWRTRTC